MQAKRLFITIITAALLLFVGFPPCGSSEAAAAKPYQKQMQQAVNYLHGVQNDDGGFPASKGGVSSRTVTSWVIMGLSASGEVLHSPAWSPAGKNPLDYLRDHPAALTETTEYARILLALSAAGQAPEYQGVDLLERISGFQQDNGQFAQTVLQETELINAHMWSVLAITSTGRAVPQQEQAKNWLISRQNSDGGFGWGQGIASDADDTGIAILALIRLGEKPDSQVMQKATAYLHSCQQPDSGLSCGDEWMGAESNAASDAWGVLGLLAAGQDITEQRWMVHGKNPLDHLLSLQVKDGSFNWKREVSSSPATMTAHALMALAGRPFPINIDYSASAPLAPAKGGFTDVQPNHWAHEPIMALVGQGTLSGYEDGSFKPDNPVSRAEFSKIIVRGIGLEDTCGSAAAEYKDVPASHWAGPSIAVCVSKGYVQGFEDGTFRPEGDISGGELAAILVRALPDYGNTAFETYPSWYSGYVAAARHNGLLYPNFSAETRVSRAQCAYSVAQLLRQIGD